MSISKITCKVETTIMLSDLELIHFLLKLLSPQGAYRMRGINKGQRLVVYAIPEAGGKQCLIWELDGDT